MEIVKETGRETASMREKDRRDRSAKERQTSQQLRDRQTDRHSRRQKERRKREIGDGQGETQIDRKDRLGRERDQKID